MKIDKAHKRKLISTLDTVLLLGDQIDLELIVIAVILQYYFKSV